MVTNGGGVIVKEQNHSKNLSKNSSSGVFVKGDSHHREDIYVYRSNHPDFSKALEDRPMLMRSFEKKE